MVTEQISSVPVTRGSRWWRHWPAWAGYVTAGWSLMYAMLGLYWTAGGDGFPFAPIDDDHRSASILEGSPVEVVAPLMALLGLLGTAVALAMARGAGTRRQSAAMITFGWIVAAGLTLIIPDYILIALLAFGPLLLVFTFTGVPGPQDGIGDILYWHRTNLIILFVGGLLWAAATLAYQRRKRGACQHCGRRHGPASDGPSRQTLLRWGRWAVVVACLAPLPYEITRVAWYFGHPLGISRDFLTMMQDTPGMLEVGLGCAIASALGGVLTHGLVSGWGEVYPRWIWFKAGKPVPPALATVPASLVAVVLIPAGLMMVWDPALGDGWGLRLPSVAWLLWGAALGAATIAYHLRRRGVCRHCGQGTSAVPAPAGLQR
ncbi:NYN domain-containing protein [Actinoplanes aureus]|uniref:NYN domain-containing protein n=1 Tax=Actinoplanes aureus TaxID=2792083 RepID=A0A931CF49_9ACTN|nr:NYN domain-containing protein [Actinoplanes aureus]MBG0566377.1 NYN domain-containing protein [Actinoplanes aureus]